jgi:hypothetical protein
VAGLGCEEHYAERYIRLLLQPHKLALVRAHKRGIIFGFSQVKLPFKMLIFLKLLYTRTFHILPRSKIFAYL